MATERRRPLHQKSDSQINAGIKPTEAVSDQQTATPSLFRNSSKLSQHSYNLSLDALYQTKQADENALSRRTSVASRLTKRSRSSSPEKKLVLVSAPAPKATSRNSSVRSIDTRIPSGPPPYSGPPQDTFTIRFVPRTPPTASAARKVLAKRSASTLSSDTSEHVDKDLLPATDYTPSPLYVTQELTSKGKKPVLPVINTKPTDKKLSTEVINLIQSLPPPPPIPDSPTRGGQLKSTIRLIPKTPPGSTPVSNRTRSNSNTKSTSTNSRSRSGTGSSSASRPRSRSSEFHRRRGSINYQFSRGSSRHSTASYFSSISAIGFPPARPLPTPPDLPTSDSFNTIPQSLPSHSTLHRYPRPILKKARTSPEISPVDSDWTPPIDADRFPEIRPALSWILESDTIPAPLKINKPKRARMQTSIDAGSSRVNQNARFDSSSSEHTGLNGASQWFSETSSSSMATPGAPSLNVQNVRGYNPHFWQAHGAQSERATVFSVGESSSGLRRDSTNPSFYTSSTGPSTVPEWARVYYGRNGRLPNHQEEEDIINTDDMPIEPVQRPLPAQLKHTSTNLSQPISQPDSIWLGTRNPEGRQLQDQFSQAHLDNFPVDRAEKLNIQILLFCVGFIFPFAWIAGALLPLPKQKRLARRERAELQRNIQENRAQGLGIQGLRHNTVDADTESLSSFTTWEESRRWENARWWRNVNRVMVIVGLCITGAIVALLVTGIRR